MRDWGAVDWAALIIAGSLGVGMIISVVMEMMGDHGDDDGSHERIILSLVAVLTLYIGTKLAAPKDPKD